MSFLTTDTLNSCRANLYWLLANLLRQPGGESAQYLEDLRQPLTIFVPELLEKSNALQTLLPKDELWRQELKVAYAKLFVGPFELAAAPYSSVYVGTQRMVMGDSTVAALSHYVAAGLDPSEDNKEPPDHIATELEFMYYLIFQHLDTSKPEFLERQKEFCLSHLSQWISGFAESIRRSEISPFYQVLGDLTEAFVLRDRQWLTEQIAH